MKGWIRVTARKLPLPIPQSNALEGLNEDDNGDTGSDFWTRNGQRRREDVLREICNINDWIEPRLDIRTDYESQAVLEKVRLEPLPQDMTLGGLVLQASGYSGAECKEYRATLDFKVKGVLQSYTLYTTPVFVTAHPCVGNHILFKTQAKLYTRNIVSAASLKNYTWDGQKFLVIDALVEGHELLARAWCAERGRHAVIRKGSDCCLACAAMMAGKIGLAFNLLIWA
jgi:hypothetical protein